MRMYHSRFILSRAGDDQRGAGFIDQHIVHFVDDGIIMTALDAFFQAHGHVVSQVIEAKLAVGAVGDIRVICLRLVDHDAAGAGPRGEIRAPGRP